MACTVVVLVVEFDPSPTVDEGDDVIDIGLIICGADVVMLVDEEGDAEEEGLFAGEIILFGRRGLSPDCGRYSFRMNCLMLSKII